MKQTTPLSKGSGKLGSVVYAVNSGVQIAREYQPKVTNPNTEAQQDTRARFKLMSQLSAVMGDVIAIKKDGLKTARNQFQSINFENVTYDNGDAQINLNQVQLTKSNISMVDFSADRADPRVIALSLNTDSHNILDRVVYVAFVKEQDASLVQYGSVVALPGDNGLFEADLQGTDKSIVIYAYGIKDKDASATTKFGNLIAPNAEQVAKLLVSSTENMNAVSLTQTKALTMEVGENSGSSETSMAETVIISVTPTTGVTITGNGVKPKNSTVTLQATVTDPTWQFVGWTKNGQQVSSQNPYSFTATENATFGVLLEQA